MLRILNNYALFGALLRANARFSERFKNSNNFQKLKYLDLLSFACIGCCHLIKPLQINKIQSRSSNLICKSNLVPRPHDCSKNTILV